MFAGFVLLILLTMKLFPELPLSRLLHHALVEAPLRRLAGMGRRHLIYAAVLIVMSFTAGELVLLFGSADIVMLLAWDVSLYVDALIATWTLSAVARSKAAWRALAARLPRLRMARPRTPRRRREGSGTAANDAEDDGRAWAYAMAA